MLTSFGIVVVTAFSGIFTARVLGPSGRGALALTILVPTAVAYLGDLGIPLGITYASARMPDRDIFVVRGMKARAATAGLLVGSVLGLIAAVLAIIFLSFRDPRQIVPAAVFAVVYIPINLSMRFAMSVDQGALLFLRFNLVRFVIPCTYTLFLVSLAAAQHLTVVTAVAATFISNLFGFSTLFTNRPVFGRPTRAEVSKWSRFGLKGHLGNLTPVDSMQLDLILAGTLLGVRAAGLYSVGATAAMFIRGQGTALGIVAFPRAAAVAASDRRSQTWLTIKVALILHVVLALIVITFAPLAIKLLFGSQYLPAVLLMRVLAIGSIFAGVRQTMSDLLRGLGQPGATSVNELQTWCIGAPLAVLLGIHFGAVGIAAGVAFAYCLAFVLMLFRISRALRSDSRRTNTAGTMLSRVLTRPKHVMFHRNNFEAHRRSKVHE